MDTSFTVTCWAGEDWAMNMNRLPPISSIPTAGDRLVGIGAEAIFTHSPGAGVEAHVCEPYWYCGLQTASFDAATPRSGLTSDGSFHTWENSYGMLQHPLPGFHALGVGTFSAAISSDNVLTGPTYLDGATTWWELPLDPDATYEQTAAFYPGAPPGSGDISACVLQDTGVIDCVGDGLLAEAVFDNGPYRFIDGDWGVVCAVREADDVIECSDGTVHDFGPVLDLSVYPYPHRPDGEDPIRTDASLCVITVDNAIRCAGPHYPQDILDQLEALPR
jgi:hypothetical protein